MTQKGNEQDLKDAQKEKRELRELQAKYAKAVRNCFIASRTAEIVEDTLRVPVRSKLLSVGFKVAPEVARRIRDRLCASAGALNQQLDQKTAEVERVVQRQARARKESDS